MNKHFIKLLCLLVSLVGANLHGMGAWKAYADREAAQRARTVQGTTRAIELKELAAEAKTSNAQVQAEAKVQKRVKEEKEKASCIIS